MLPLHIVFAKLPVFVFKGYTNYTIHVTFIHNMDHGSSSVKLFVTILAFL